MGFEACKLSEELWTGFMHDSFQTMIRFRQLQAQQPYPLLLLLLLHSIL